eukprot:Plantae.Rhodophyta-Purpureofilum_apyrenoidigerum.ctg8429.p1 GENE.Plantae.Rhodophyta-Purpureofilum_apyrenoidigerum.ctg8429~~Plantae.Rhodophyta-Purpureofilum_apyrenoidigerum.ctg8429.p1  ORF type:complete len:615 (-),score=104.60 Plantae.Rhodophyta-Purpureofilum_apyrenoidigerum.ctg8429:374-2218(-)
MGKTLVSAEQFNPRILYELLCGHDAELREEIYELFKREPELFKPQHHLSLREQRELLMRRWDRLHELGYFKNTITSGDPKRYLARLAVSEVCEMLDHSLSVKMGVHYGLFGSSVGGLGTPEQAKYWLTKAEEREVMGCFALSELGAGSNVRGIGTQAVYDRDTDQFIIHTPNEAAQKYWIGGAAESANYTVAFAKLTVAGEQHGIHAFVVRLRDDRGNVVSGVTVADCGHKWGLNGVDNGRIWFNHVAVPRKDMLSKLSWVTADGRFESSVSDPNERFGRTLAALTGGRVSIIFSAVNQLKVGTTIAARYAKSRDVFNSQLVDIQTHRLRLFPYMCGAIVMNLVGNSCKIDYYANNLAVTRDMHVMSSGLKAMATWEMTKCLQECREACGGQGMLSENRVGPLVSEFNVAMTFEGDNHVLTQQVSKAVVSQYASGKRKGKYNGYLSFMNKDLDCEDQHDVASLDFIQAAMHCRLVLLLTSLERRSGKMQKDPRQSVQNNLVLFEEIGIAHTEQILFESFASILSQIPDPAVAKLVKQCGVLYGLYRIDLSPSFCRSTALSSKKAWEVRDNLLKLCTEFGDTGEWEKVLEAFNVPDILLAPIARDWLTHNARSRL